MRKLLGGGPDGVAYVRAGEKAATNGEGLAMARDERSICAVGRQSMESGFVDTMLWRRAVRVKGGDGQVEVLNSRCPAAMDV